ncbi:hypothetical protein GCM10023325_08610 [Sphingomonas lutea]
MSLNPFERAVLGEILRRFNGYNNGSIGISYEQIGDRLKGQNKSRPNNARIAAAIVRLIDRGLVGDPEPESWMQRRAREYRLTFITSGKAPPFKCATNEYLRWEPSHGKIGGDGASPERCFRSDPRSPSLLSFGDARSPPPSKNGSFTSVENPSPGDRASLLISKPYTGLKSTAAHDPQPPVNSI